MSHIDYLITARSDGSAVCFHRDMHAETYAFANIFARNKSEKQQHDNMFYWFSSHGAPGFFPIRSLAAFAPSRNFALVWEDLIKTYADINVHK